MLEWKFLRAPCSFIFGNYLANPVAYNITQFLTNDGCVQPLVVIERLHGEHVESLNIGLAPLAGVAKSDEKFPSRAALTVVRHLGAPYYSFQGLEQFKRKFKPEWEPRTLLYDGSLSRVMQDIERAATLHGQSRWKFYIITGSGVALLVMGIYLIVS